MPIACGADVACDDQESRSEFPRSQRETAPGAIAHAERSCDKPPPPPNNRTPPHTTAHALEVRQITGRATGVTDARRRSLGGLVVNIALPPPPPPCGLLAHAPVPVTQSKGKEGQAVAWNARVFSFVASFNPLARAEPQGVSTGGFFVVGAEPSFGNRVFFSFWLPRTAWWPVALWAVACAPCTCSAGLPCLYASGPLSYRMRLGSGARWLKRGFKGCCQSGHWYAGKRLGGWGWRLQRV